MYQTSPKFKAAVQGTHKPVVRVRALYGIQVGANPVGGQEIEVISGNVKLSSTADIKGTLDLTVPGKYWDALLPYGVELFCERGVDFGDGTQEWVPLGYFRVQKVNQDDMPDGQIVVTAQDRTARLKETRVSYPYAYPAGTTHRQIFDFLINGEPGKRPFDLSVSYGMYFDADIPVTFLGYDPDQATLPAGVVDDLAYDFLAKITDARGCVVMFERTGGVIVVQREVAPGTPSVYTVRPGENGNLLKMSRSLDRTGVYNGVVARGSDPQQPTGYGFANNANIGSPLYWAGNFGPTQRKYASPLVRTNDQAVSASQKLLSRYKGLPSGVSALILPDPSLDPLDPITILNKSLSADEIIDYLTIPLTIKDAIPVTTRTLNEVAVDDGSDDGGGSGGGPVFPAQFRDSRAYPLVTASGASGTTVNVTSSADLTSKLANAAGGSTLLLADGTYTGTFTINKKASQSAPIVIKAANQGKAVLASGSKFIADGAEWCLITGLAAPQDAAGDVFVIQGASKFVRFTRCLVGPATAPSGSGNFTMAVGSCCNNPDSAAYSRIASMDPDIMAFTGDLFYADGSSGWTSHAQAQFNAPNCKAMLDKLAAKAEPVTKGKPIVIPSDHDGTFASNGTAGAATAAMNADMRAMFPDVVFPIDGCVARTFTKGRVRFIALDERSFKSPNSATDNSSKVILGAAQEAWLKGLLASPDYPLIVMLTDVPIIAATTAGDDGYKGYNTERQRLATAFGASPATLIRVSGDMHCLYKATPAYGLDKIWGFAPFHNDTKVKAGGDGISQSYPTNGSSQEGTVMEQFGFLTFTDNGSTITCAMQGISADGTVRITDSISVSAAGAGPTSPSTPAGTYFRVTGQAADCVIDYNELRGKTRPGNGIAVDGNTGVAANAGGCQHILIAHNDIHDFGTEVASNFEAIRFGSSDLSRTDSNSAVIRNVLTGIACEAEVISLNMAKVDCWGNTLDKCVGGIVQRFGTAGYIGHNYVRGPATGSAGTKAGGIRIYDADQRVEENYVEATNGAGNQGALVVDGGDASPTLSSHWPVKNAKVLLNVLADNQTGIQIGPNFSVAPDAIAVSGNIVTNAKTAATAVQNIKTPTGASTLTPNTYAATDGAAGLTRDSDGIWRKDGVGPRMTYLSRDDVGVAGDTGETDGSGRSLSGTPGDPSDGGGTPTDPGGGTPPGGTATSPSDLLKVGTLAGWTKANIGIGFAPSDPPGVHTDYSLADLVNGKSVPGYFELTPDKLRVRMSAHLDGKTTSTNTKYSRVEFRELKQDGVTKMSFNPNAVGRVFVGSKFRVTKMPPQKPQLCCAQVHDASDDVAMIYMASKTLVQAKLGDTVLGTLTSNFVFDTDYTCMIEIIGDGSKCKLNYYWNDLTTPKFTTDNATRSTTWYLKAGCYAQSNASTDSVSDGPFIYEMSKIAMWHTGDPALVGWP